MTTNAQQAAHLYSLESSFKSSSSKYEMAFEGSKLVWLVKLRWAAILLFFCLIAPGHIFGFLDRFSTLVFVGLIGFLFVFNLFTHLIFVESRKHIKPLFICFQLTLDLFILTILLFISGGFKNPFVALFLLNAGLGGVLIKGRLSWPFIFLCHTFLIALQIQYFLGLSGLIVNSHFWIYVFASHVLVLSVWLVMRSLGSYLEKHFESQAFTHIQLEKQDRLRALGALAAGFSHEFASPLNAAKLRLDRLERSFENRQNTPDWIDQAKANLSAAKKSIESCEAVIHSMNSSQLDVREQNIKPIHMNEFIKDVTESWLEEHPQTNLVIDNTLTEQLSVSPINLAQVVLNLLDNAFESNPKGKIYLRLKSQDSWMKLIVEDEGAGFDDRVLSRRGEPFVTTKIAGTGLGLYVSEIFVQSLGGYLLTENKSQRAGAVVTLTWPLQKEAL